MIGRRSALVLAVLLLTVLFFAPASADEGWVVQSFAADITIERDASLRITEAIDVDFGAQRRHGIFRTIPVRYTWDETRVRIYRLNVRWVTDARDRPIKFETSQDGPYAVVKIGDADVLVSGAQSYRINYDLQGALNAFGDHDELYWNVNGGDWDVPMRRVSATVHAPGGVRQVTCFQGRSGATEPCRASSTEALADFAATRSLAIGEQLTIVTSLAKGTVSEPSPIIERDSDNLLAYFEPRASNLAAAVFVLIAGIALLVWRWYTVGRDLRERETIVPEYEPPDSLRPAHLGLLLDERADTKDVTATIVDLAVRGYLTITEAPETGLFAKKDWILHETGRPRSDLLPFEDIVYTGLFHEHPMKVKMSELRTHFVGSLRSAEGELYRDSAARKWFATRPDRVRQAFAGLAVLTIVVGAGLAWLLGRTLGAGLVGVALSGVGIVAMPFARVMPAKTATGAELLRRTLGFRHYMEIAEKERQRFAERENIFSAYLPYAIVFGCVERWARAFKDIDTSAETASWYVGSAPFNAGALSSSLQSFNSNLGSAIASTPGSSGSSGFSGGGAGGGGGGGGGGSW